METTSRKVLDQLLIIGESMLTSGASVNHVKDEEENG